MRIIEVDASKKDIFNNFLKENNACFLQSFEWGDFKNNYSYWDVKRLILSYDNEIKAAATILIRKIPFLQKTFFYIPRGPVVKDNNEKVFFEFIKEIKKLSPEYRSIFLKTEPELDENNSFYRKNFISNKKHIQPRCTIIIDLKKDEDTLLSEFESKTRYNIRIASKKGIEIKKSEDSSFLSDFFLILEQTGQRQKFFIHQKSYYKTLWNIFAPENMIHLFLAYYQKKPIAGILLLSFGKKCWYLYGASSQAHRETMPNQALHWEVLKWAKKNGIDEYDLWGIPCPDNNNQVNMNHPLFGVWRFKKGFGGNIVKYSGTFDEPYSSLYYLWEKSMKTYFLLRNLWIRGETTDALQE